MRESWDVRTTSRRIMECSIKQDVYDIVHSKFLSSDPLPPESLSPSQFKVQMETFAFIPTFHSPNKKPSEWLENSINTSNDR